MREFAEVLSAKLLFPSGESNEKVKVGDEFTIDIVIDKNPGIVAMAGSVTYNAERLQLVSVTGSSIYGSLQTNSNISKNPYKQVWNKALAEQDVTTTGSAATLTFKILDNAAAGNYSLLNTAVTGRWFPSGTMPERMPMLPERCCLVYLPIVLSQMSL